MKKIILLISLSVTPLFAGPYCIDNSEHLQKPYDNKEWHSVNCACDCTTIKGGRCTDCGHMQNARTYTIINSSFAPSFAKSFGGHSKATADTASSISKAYAPENPQNALKNLTVKYMKNKYDI
jgi:hypothetical protein